MSFNQFVIVGFGLDESLNLSIRQLDVWYQDHRLIPNFNKKKSSLKNVKEKEKLNENCS